MSQAIVEKFKKMGADVNVRYMPLSRQWYARGLRGSPGSWRTVQLSPPPFAIDILEGKKETFELRIAENMKDRIDLEVLECVPEERHLVLFARVPEQVGLPERRPTLAHLARPARIETRISKMHFLCGHDERHWFVAGVQPCSTVREAKASLKPKEVRDVEAKVGLKASKSNKRHNEAWIRQGEWFFVPTPGLKVTEYEVRKDEPITRPGARGGKPHTAQFAARSGGEQVMVKGTNARPSDVMTLENYAKLKPEDRLGYVQMTRNPQLYVRGTVRHADHATIDLGVTWHRVYMNSEKHELRGRTVAFLD